MNEHSAGTSTTFTGICRARAAAATARFTASSSVAAIASSKPSMSSSRKLVARAGNARRGRDRFRSRRRGRAPVPSPARQRAEAAPSCAPPLHHRPPPGTADREHPERRVESPCGPSPAAACANFRYDGFEPTTPCPSFLHFPGRRAWSAFGAVRCRAGSRAASSPRSRAWYRPKICCVPSPRSGWRTMPPSRSSRRSRTRRSPARMRERLLPSSEVLVARLARTGQGAEARRSRARASPYDHGAAAGQTARASRSGDFRRGPWRRNCSTGSNNIWSVRCQAKNPSHCRSQENFLRIMTAHVQITPSGREFFVDGNDKRARGGAARRTGARLRLQRRQLRKVQGEDRFRPGASDTPFRLRRSPRPRSMPASCSCAAIPRSETW